MLFQKGHIPWNKNLKGIHLSPKTEFTKDNLPAWAFKKGHIPWSKGKHVKGHTAWNKGQHMNYAGSKHHWWQGGKTKEIDRLRMSLEYKLWRKSVFERDNYTCTSCGDNKGNNLEADHIKPQSLYPELRFAINNGRTLCKTCHKKTETWGRKLFKYAKRGSGRSVDLEE